MICEAIKTGVAEEKIARALNVDVRESIQRRDLLNGICGEAADQANETDRSCRTHECRC